MAVVDIRIETKPVEGFWQDWKNDWHTVREKHEFLYTLRRSYGAMVLEQRTIEYRDRHWPAVTVTAKGKPRKKPIPERWEYDLSPEVQRHRPERKRRR